MSTTTAADYRFEHALFDRTGVELEYMIVGDSSLDVAPLADRVLRAVTGDDSGDAEPDGPGGPIGWSNELALHVLEFKTLDPASSLDPLPELFQSHVRRAEEILRPMGARLMPTAMHPWMDPHADLRLWPHDNGEIYGAFNRIFSCRGHGWANLQSAHINLPFADDEQFGRLHAAIRLLLPIMPALAASSPVMDGRVTGVADNRLDVYRTNARNVPSVSGRVVPERVFTRAAYEGELLAGVYRDIAPHDPEGLLQHEWLNARGAIARFMRGSIEIRVLDVQECPLADIAICAAIVESLKAITRERWGGLSEQQAFEIEPLADILAAATADGDESEVTDEAYLRALGWLGGPCSAADLWRHLIDAVLPADSRWRAPLSVVLDEGALSKRIVRALGPAPDRARLREVYGALCECLRSGRQFRPGA